MQTYKLKFGTIVVATDLSGAASSTALRYAQAIARAHESTLVVVHAIDPVGYAFPNGAPEFTAADAAAREELRKIEEQAARDGIPVHSVVATGVIYQRILQATHDYKADLLVLGTRARTGIGRAALGTVARQMLAKAECPVLTVSPDAENELAWAGHWRHVLVATDFSAASLSALRCAHGIAHMALIALHVPLCSDEHECSHCLERLRFLAPLNESHTVPVEHIVKSGDAAELIAENARAFDADLVVLGSPENELGEEDFRSSTVLQVISRVRCPVLCVPASNRAEQATEVISEVCYRG
jgi:nucleotide-binding universal stress UspA family protein